MSIRKTTPTDGAIGRRITFFTSAVVSLVVIATLLILNVCIRDAVSKKVNADLAGSKATFDIFLKDRFETLFVNARIIADTPRFKSLLDTPGIDHETVLFSLNELKQLVNCDLLTITDPSGKVLARVTSPFWHGDDMTANPGVRSALSGKEKASLRLEEGKLYQIVSVPVTTKGVVQGALVAGFELNQAFADRFREMTSSDLAVVSEGKLILASGGVSERSQFEYVLNRYAGYFTAESFRTNGPNSVTMQVLDETELGIIAPFSASYGFESGFNIIKKSLTKATAFYREIRIILILIGLLAIVISFAAGRAMARRISRPILQLTAAAGEYAKGNLRHRVAASSNDEVGTLTEAFNRMASDLGSARDGLIAARDDLESKVTQRTWELGEANRNLQSSFVKVELRNREMTLLSEMDDVFQACGSVDELHGAVRRLIEEKLPGWAGGISAMRPSIQPLEVVVSWGRPIFRTPVFMPQECVALRLGRMYFVESLSHAMILCRHFKEPAPSAYLCVPLTAAKSTFGVIHLCPPAGEAMNDDRKRFVGTMARHISLALANLMLREKLQAESIRDPLTGLYNRRYMEEALETELVRSHRNGRGVGVMMIDVDQFKKVNDAHGHDAGDMVLCAIAQFISDKLRGGDILCRYGGEEFTLIMPDVTPETFKRKAGELREGFKKVKTGLNGSGPNAVTLSFGLAIYPENGSEGKRLLRSADEALYQAKEAGRDCIRTAFAG